MRIVLALAFVLVAANVRAVEPPQGFTPLFNGRDLDGWHGWAIHAKNAAPAALAKRPMDERAKLIHAWTEDARKHWTVRDGELVNDGLGAYLATDKDYGDIELRVEYRTVAKADSGIYLRATPQVQIWDTTQAGGKWDRHADKGSGGLFNNAQGSPGQLPLVHADRPFGAWNTLRIVMVGERVSVWLNDQLVVDHARMENYWDRRKPLPKYGPILLQTHGGEIRWRNLFVRELPPTEANAILMKKGAERFGSIFNGQDFTGWTGAVDQYEVKDGAIVCKPRKGGNLFTKEEYSDFAVRLEYRVPPAGNNGLAIRYPGKGQPSIVAMCEIQILDDDAPVYAKLDPRQYNGSAYGMTAAQRGYDRPAGQWNVMEVTVVGPTIVTELNGTRILDTDLSQVTAFIPGHTHPGKSRRRGHFGFAGHSDPVAFRNIAIERRNTVK